MISISIDIGSTWTKGAAFRVGENSLEILARESRPTTSQNLSNAFFDVLRTLTNNEKLSPDDKRKEIKLAYSSSAKGGLEVAALGIVPEITLESARMAAYSAGAKVTRSFSYRLSRSDIRNLEESPPDILLFSGGTDGGNTDFVLENAGALAKSSVDCAIVYCGNRDLADEVEQRLAHRNLTIVENVLPNMETTNPEPAREAIREIFLKQIVKGKGLDVIVRETGVEPLPTPYSVFEFVREISQREPGWDNFVLFDMGGATTDVYSALSENLAHGAIFRGLPEPEIKRTVEGDLGLRVSAKSAEEAVSNLLSSALGGGKERAEAFSSYVDKVSRDPKYLPDDEEGKFFDSMLAGACLAQSCSRHAGRMADVYTIEGKVQVQTGRNLKEVKRIIGSGGWLAQASSFDPSQWFSKMQIDSRGKVILMPQQFAYYYDEQYVLPILANVARDFPAQAARTGVSMLVHKK